MHASSRVSGSEPHEGIGGRCCGGLRWVVVLAFTLPGICTPVFGQALRWESLVADPRPEGGEEGWFKGRHIAPVDGESFVLTGERQGGYGSGVARMTAEGELVWSKAIIDIDSVINPGIGEAEEVYIRPEFSFYQPEDQTLTFFGHQRITLGALYGPLYLLKMNLDGDPIDTIAGTRDRIAFGELTSRWLHTSDNRFVVTSDYPYESDSNAYALYYTLYPPSLRFEPDSGAIRGFFRPGEQSFFPQIHYPTKLVEAENGDVIVWGSGGTVNGVPYNVYKPFFLRISPDGEEVVSTNPIEDTSTSKFSRSIAATRDGGFIGTYWIGAEYSDEDKIIRADGGIIRMDSSGKGVWETTIGEDYRDYELSSVVELPDGNLVVCGYVNNRNPEDPIRIIPQSSQFFLACLLRDGGIKWRYEWGENGVDNGLYDMIALPDGDVVVVGLQNNKMYVARVRTVTLSVDEIAVPLRIDLSSLGRLSTE